MKNKFENVPKDKDTRIIASLEITFGEYRALHQGWCWDGIIAESLIFFNEDIKDLTEDELVEEVRLSPLISAESREKGITYKLSGEFTFVNFNFEIL